MRKTTKGAVAASAAALLLLGGWGTQAGWGDGKSIQGTRIDSGSLKLTQVSCDGWKIGTDAVDPTAIKIIPGTVLTQVCTFRVDALGYKLEATVGTSTNPTVSGVTAGDAGLATALQATAMLTQPDGTPLPAKLSNTAQIKATIQVTLPSSATGEIQNMAAQLAAYTVSINQA